MDGCLLCLELNSCFEDYIKVDSTQWLELNIKNLIEKHLWSLETINPSAMICTICWQELYDFHKFYKRIESVHMDIGTIMKNEVEPEIQMDALETKIEFKGFGINDEDACDPLYKEPLIECKNEVLMEQLIPTTPIEAGFDNEQAIKEEPEDIYEDVIPLLRKGRKKGTCKNLFSKTKRKRTKTKELFSKNCSPKVLNEKGIDQEFKNNNEENVKKSLSTKDNRNPRKSSYTFFETNTEKDEFLASNYKITCILCDQPMETFSALCKHFQSEHNEPGYVICCKKKFSTRSILIDHILSHLNPNHFKCNQCGKIMSDRQSLDTHSKIIHKNNIDWREYCNICGEGFPDIQELKNHKLSHNLQENPAYKLPESNKEKDDFLAKHYKISCILCEQPMETFEILCKHFKMEHNQPGYVICCNKKFGTRSILVDHVHCHLNPDHFKCNHCGKVMSDRQCLEKHIRKRHVGNVEKNHFCDICGKGFADRTGLRLHKAVHLPEEEKKFKCTECDKNFANEEGLAQHVRFIHLKKNVRVCDICGKTIRYSNLFKRHMLEHEGKPLPTVSCDVCGRRLSDKISLKRHKQRHHSGEKREHSCNICLKVVTSIYSLRKHITIKHERGYDQKCTICEKTFNRPQALRDHLARHAGTALHSCPWCSKSFYSNGHMHAHRKKAHPKEWEEAQREKFSGNLPPNYIPPEIN